MLDHEYTSKKIFSDNFFGDWRKEMNDEERKLIKDLSKCDFKEIHVYYVQVQKSLHPVPCSYGQGRRYWVCVRGGGGGGHPPKIFKKRGKLGKIAYSGDTMNTPPPESKWFRDAPAYAYGLE